ncbi:MAG: ABC transporter permease subunit [Gemmatimonadales bacterium]
MTDLLAIFLRKELRDLRANPQVLPGYLLLPAVAVLLPVILLAVVPLDPGVTDAGGGVADLFRLADLDPALAGFPPRERMIRLAIREFGAFFLLIPVILSSMSAALSVAAEKQQRTLEPLLATPIDDRTFLLAKLVAAVGPAIVVTWGAALVEAAGVGIVTAVRIGTTVLPGWPYLVAIVLVVPLGGIVAALVGMLVSVRAPDVQAAIQSAGLWVVPAALVLIGSVGRPAFRGVLIALIVALVLAGAAAALFRRLRRRFEREEILTRWA